MITAIGAMLCAPAIREITGLIPMVDQNSGFPSLPKFSSVPPVDVEEMAFAFALFQGAMRQRVAAPDPTRRFIELDPDELARPVVEAIDGLVRADLFSVRDGTLRPTDTPFHRAIFALKDHYENDPKQAAYVGRIAALFFFTTRNKERIFRDYTKPCEEDPAAMLIHSAVINAAATVPLTDFTFEPELFFRTVDELRIKIDNDEQG